MTSSIVTNAPSVSQSLGKFEALITRHFNAKPEDVVFTIVSITDAVVATVAYTVSVTVKDCAFVTPQVKKVENPIKISKNFLITQRFTIAR